MTDLSPIYKWDAIAEPRGAVHILHGMADHGGRYGRFAAHLNGAGFVVWAHDHRGHGRNPTAPVGYGHFADVDGWRRVIDDAWEVSAELRAGYPRLPLVVFGHSMGSFVAQTLIAEHGEEYDAAILCGTGGPPTAFQRAIGVVAAAQRRVLGGRHAGIWLDRLVLDTYNRHFAPNRTRFDWLSRDEREVDAYISDEHCGFPLTAQSWYDFLRGKPALGDEIYLRGIPKALPIHIIAGTRDPVGEEGRGVHRLLDLYRRLGLTRVSHRFYEDARHELVNELNREEVTRDVIAWLHGVVSES